jgi:hypothetical protein
LDMAVLLASFWLSITIQWFFVVIQ